VDPDDSVANLGARIVSQLSDVRAGLETADVQRSMSGLDQTYPLWEKMGFSRQELEPLLVQTLVLQFLDSVEPVSVMTEESVIVAREPLSLLQSTAMNQEHLAAAERALNQLVVVENNFRESRFEPIPELLASVEQDLSSFADRPVELSAARNHFVIESSRAKLRKNEEFSQSLALANEKLAIRPIDIEMIRDARQAFVALKETRPDRALTVQVIDNLQHIETALTRLAENDVAGASQAVANIELLAGATDAEGALLSEIEATITSARVTYHIDQLGVALANPPLDSTRLQQARSSFDRAVDANGNSEAVRGASLLLQDLDAVVKNIDEINPDEAQFALDRAIGRLTTLGFDKTVLAHVDQQIQASHQALDKQKLDEKVDELLNTAQRRIEANPDDQAAIDQSYRDSNKILLELDSTNAKAGDLLQLVTLLNDSIIAHQELRNDDALEYLTKSKPVFRKLDMNDAALDGLMAKIQSQQDYNVDVEIDKLFDSWLENIRVNPFDAKILDQATTDMTRLAALRPGDKVVLLASEITGHLRKADESIDSGEFVEARLNLARARDAFSTLDIGDGWLNKAYEELERIKMNAINKLKEQQQGVLMYGRYLSRTVLGAFVFGVGISTGCAIMDSPRNSNAANAADVSVKNESEVGTKGSVSEESKILERVRKDSDTQENGAGTETDDMDARLETTDPKELPVNDRMLSDPSKDDMAGWQHRVRGIELISTGDWKLAARHLKWAAELEQNPKLANMLLEQLSADPEEYLGTESYSLGDGLKFPILARYNDIAVPQGMVENTVLRIPGDPDDAENSGMVKPAPAPVEKTATPIPADTGQRSTSEGENTDEDAVQTPTGDNDNAVPDTAQESDGDGECLAERSTTIGWVNSNRHRSWSIRYWRSIQAIFAHGL